MHSQKTPFLYLGAIAAFPLLVFDLYQPALPAITAYFKTTHALGQLTLSLFFFVLGLSQLIWGPLIDHYGRRKTLNFSFILFLMATLFCLLATNIYLLIGGRALQGFSVCCLSMIAFTCSRDEDDSTDRARLLSHIAMIVSVSPIFAPLIGSFIFVYCGWRATFLVMALLGAALLVIGRYILKESPFWKPSNNSLSIKASLLTYRELLTHKSLWIATAIITTSYSCIMIVVVNISYLMIDNLGVSPVLFSIFFAGNGLIIIAGNFIGIKLRKHRSLIWNIILGTLVMTGGSLLMIILFYIQGLSLLSLLSCLIINMGVMLLTPPTLSLAMARYKEQPATASAFLNTIRITSSALIAGFISTLLIQNTFILPWSLLFCSIVCLIICLFFNEQVQHPDEN